MINLRNPLKVDLRTARNPEPEVILLVSRMVATMITDQQVTGIVVPATSPFNMVGSSYTEIDLYIVMRYTLKLRESAIFVNAVNGFI